MIEQVKVLKTAIEKAMESGILSQPYAIPLPPDMPFRAAVASVALPPGCTPPEGVLPLRFGSGVGPTQESAAILALTEAVERYALQYGTDRPTQLDPILTEGGAPAPAFMTELTLGAPDRPDASSIGAAAGVDLADATERALLEVLEHFHVAEDGDLTGPFVALDPKLVPEVFAIMHYLDHQLRALDLATLVSPLGYCVARALCRDFDGGRPTLGSAAGHVLGETVQRAAEEAVLLWRNMVEIEHRSLPASAVPGRQQRILRAYRGAESLEVKVPARDSTKIPNVPQAEADLAQIVRAVTGQRVRVFDLTMPPVAIAVARVMLG